MPPKTSVSKVGKGCVTTEVSHPRVVPNMLSTRVKPSLPPLSNIFSATKMKPFSTPFARKSCDPIRRGGGKVEKKSFISGSESESEQDSVYGGKEASKVAVEKGSVGGDKVAVEKGSVTGDVLLARSKVPGDLEEHEDNLGVVLTPPSPHSDSEDDDQMRERLLSEFH